MLRKFIPTKAIIPDLNPGSGCRGFTLLELLVVMFIIGLITGLAALSVGQDQGRKVEEEARRLRALMDLAGQEAVLQSQELAVEIYSNGYRFLRLQVDQSGEQWQWQAIARDRIFRPRCLPIGITMALEMDGEKAELDEMSCAMADKLAFDAAEDAFEEEMEQEDREFPRIFLLSSGEMTPFQIALLLEERISYRLVGELTGKLAVYGAQDGQPE